MPSLGHGKKISAVQILTNATAPVSSERQELWTGRFTAQITGTTSAGAGAATVLVEGSLDGTNYVLLATLALTLGVAVTSDGVAIDASWRYTRLRVSAISGTDATVQGWFGG